MTVEQLATELEIAYWGNNATRIACGDDPTNEEAYAARVHLPKLARITARSAARWARKAHRPAKYQPPYVADTVARDSMELIRRDPTCGALISVVGWLLLKTLLENLAWRFAAWLFSDSTHEDRPELICRMAVD